jgi:hypothetical protein
VSSRALLPAVATGAFLAGFGIAELTGVRALGGLVLLAGGAWCARVAMPIAGRAATGALVLVAVALFALSHPLGHAIGSWPAVFVTGALAGVAAGVVVGRPARPKRA